MSEVVTKNDLAKILSRLPFLNLPLTNLVDGNTVGSVRGIHTITGANYQTAIGKYNDNKNDTAFEIGNGTSSVRSNAFTVDWQGNVKAAKTITGNNGTRDIDLQISETTIQAFVDLGMQL